MFCNDPNYGQPFSYGTRANPTDKYSRYKSTYGGCLQGEKKNGVFMREAEPSRRIEQNYCRFNNQCPDTEAYTYLNERGVKPSPFFEPSTLPYVNGTVYRSVRADDRLYDTSRDYNMKLDIPPIQVYYDLIHDNVSGSKELSGYGKNYKDYKSVTGGQIQYYVDKDIAQPFPAPVYAFPTESVGKIYRDPQGTVRPQFEKSFDSERGRRTGMLSFIEDTTKFRDDIISKQQQTHNERRYDLVYGRLDGKL